MCIMLDRSSSSTVMGPSGAGKVSFLFWYAHQGFFGYILVSNYVDVYLS